MTYPISLPSTLALPDRRAFFCSVVKKNIKYPFVS